MRIIHSLEGASWSGGQQQALFLCQGLARAGHEVLLVCQTGSVLAQRAATAGVKVRPVPFRRELDPASLLGLYREFQAFRPDLINVHRAWAHTMWALVALVTRFRGLVVTRRVLFRPDFNPISLVKYRTSAVRGYIAVSDAVADRLTSLGIAPRRVKVVHPATDTDRFDPARIPPLREPLPTPPGAVVGLMVANYHPNKGHLVLLEAFQQAAPRWPDLHLVLAGTGTDGPEMRDRVAAAGLTGRVHLLGFRDDVPALMAASRFTINASFEEGLAGTVRESAAMGVPVLASDNASNRELGRRLPLAWFRPGSAADLAGALLRFQHRSPTAPERLALRQAAIDAFSVSAMVEATLAAYRALVPEVR